MVTIFATGRAACLWKIAMAAGDAAPRGAAIPLLRENQDCTGRGNVV
ncbi:MAG: hypothetical protein IKO14_02610 [Oscillibacter sp.]|nr:hypothetical protein [Oscillibacter sp.]